MSESRQLAELISALKCKCDTTNEEIRGKTNLSPSEYKGLLSIEYGEELTAAEFSERMKLSPSRGSRVIDKMVSQKYLVVKRSSEDRRRVMIELGSEGLNLKKDIQL